MGSDQTSDPQFPLEEFSRAIASACKCFKGFKPDDIMGAVYLLAEPALKKAPARTVDKDYFFKFIRRIAINYIKNQYRISDRQAHLVDPTVFSNLATSEPSRLADLPEFERLLEALKDYDPRYGEVLRLYSQGVPRKVIAAKFGVHPTTVDRWKREAIDILRERFPEYFETDDPERSDP